MMTEKYNDGQNLDLNDGIENSAEYPNFSMFTALTMLNDEYAVELDDDTFIERAYKIWRGIGNRAKALHILKAPVDEEKKIWLPGNVESIENVTSLEAFKDIWGTEMIIYNNGTVTVNQDYLVSIITDRRLANSILNGGRSRIEGLYVDYNHNGDHISFKSEDLINSYVIVVYNGVISDEQALPKISYREAEAIAAGVAYLHYKKLALLGDSNAATMVPLLKQEKDILIGQARIPDFINNNTMDRILDAKTTFDRKNYNRTYKYNG